MCDYFHQFLTAILCFRSQDAFEHEHNAKPCSIFPLQAHTGLWWSRHRKNTYFAMFYFLSESYRQPQLPNTVTSLTSAISLRKVTSGCIYISPQPHSLLSMDCQIHSWWEHQKIPRLPTISNMSLLHALAYEFAWEFLYCTYISFTTVKGSTQIFLNYIYLSYLRHHFE